MSKPIHHAAAAPGIPSAEQVKVLLSRLTPAQVTSLSVHSSVPRPTLDKIRSGATKNPGIDTVRAFWPFLGAV